MSTALPVDLSGVVVTVNDMDSSESAKPMIHKKLVDLRKSIGGLKAVKKAGVPYKTKDAALLMEKLRKGLDDLNLTACVIDQEVNHYPQVTDETGDITTCVHVTATIRIEAEDGSYRDMVGSGHGFSSDDKAGGKASTYAWKDALIKGLCLPDADMVDADDESKPLKVAPKKTAVQAWSEAFDNCNTSVGYGALVNALHKAVLPDADRAAIGPAVERAKDRT